MLSSHSFTVLYRRITCKEITMVDLDILKMKHKYLGWLAHLVSRFACNSRVIGDGSLGRPLSVTNCCNKI